VNRAIVFLMYHELELPGRALCQSQPGYVRYIVSTANFQEQMRSLNGVGWQGISVTRALDFPANPSVAITFDDGCETDLLAAAPILNELGFRATFYVITGFLGRTGYLSPTQARELADLGFEIGCHSMTHAYLSDLDGAGLQREIVEAKIQLEQILGRPVLHFSCPGGRFNQRVIETARAAGYRTLSTSRAHANSASVDLFRLGRVSIMRGMRPETIERICRSQGLWRSQLIDLSRAAAKRLLGNSSYDRLRAALLSRSNH
jgi:peptidoglycan/xylan/chitin deacetylase (PgdA/CDA1 family)